MANQGQKQELNPVQRLDGLTQAARGAAAKDAGRLKQLNDGARDLGLDG